MTSSQWNDVILFFLLCRWLNFKIGTFGQITRATKRLLAWQMPVALKWDLWISVTKGACCLVLIVASDQPANARAKLFSGHLRMFWLKFRWRLVFLDLAGAVHEQLLLYVPFADELQEAESCWVGTGSRKGGNLFPCRLHICTWKWDGPEAMNPYYQNLTLFHSCRAGCSCGWSDSRYIYIGIHSRFIHRNQ